MSQLRLWWIVCTVVLAFFFGSRSTPVATSADGNAALLQPQGRGGGPPPTPQAMPVPELRFRYVGPPSAGRFITAAGIPGDPNVVYVGAASGGVWKTTNAGSAWDPIFDDQSSQAIGALAIAPSDPNVVWAGTGEACVIRPSDVMGDGIYKSTDAGRTWRHMGLRETGRIAKVVVHPTDPNTVYACALGRATGPQQERGVFKTSDGGQTWNRVLFVNPDTGCSGLSIDANDPNVLVAGMWQVVLHTWAMFSGGPGSGVHITRDGGKTWKQAEAGMPRPPVGKIDVAIAPSDSKRMYALIQTANQGSLWRSDDAGNTWRVTSWDRTLIGRAGYYIHLEVNPGNADEVVVANSSLHRSTDGGLTFPLGGGCGDCHGMWFDRTNPDRWILTSDGGFAVTTDHGQNYTSTTLPNGQMYHVAVDERMPYWIYSNRQDDGTMRGPSDSPVPVPNVPSYAARMEVPLVGRGGPPGFGGRGGRGGGAGGRGRGAAPVSWQQGIGGCESGFTLPSPGDPDIIYASCYGNEVTRFDNRVGRARSISPWIHTLDSEPTKIKYRCHWTPPLAFDPFDRETVYYGCQVIFKTSDQGQTWQVISPDLSTQDPTRIVSSGGVIGDNLGQFYGEVVFAIAPSPIQKGLIWAGTNDGKVWYTTQSGGEWIDVTKGLTGMPPWGTVSKIEPSRFDPKTAYVVFDYHNMDNRDPWIFKTSDMGKTWTKISDALPKGHPLDYAISLAENPNTRGMLFAGTGRGFYYSMDDGKTWTNLQGGLPRAPVTWIVVQKNYHDIVVSTYGRGLWVMDDITRLEQSGQPSPTTSENRLYTPRNAFRLARSGEARFLFSLSADPAGNVPIEILDGAGQVIRRLQVGARAGLNAATWDLRYEPPKVVALRTTPPDNPHIWEEPRFKGRETRPIIHWGIQGAQVAAPIAAPGKYSVRMTLGGQTFTQPFEVVKDRQIPSSDADLVESTKAQIRVRDAMNEAVEAANRVEIMRKQIEDLLNANRGRDDIEKALRDLDQKALDVEMQLLSRTDLHSDDKWYVESYRIYMQLVWLNGVIGFGAGDVAGGAEYRPTSAALAWLGDLEKELADAKAALTTLLDRDLPAFNKMMAGRIRIATDQQ